MKWSKLLGSRRSPVAVIVIIGLFVMVIAIFQSRQQESARKSTISSGAVNNTAKGYNAYPDATDEDVIGVARGGTFEFDRPAPLFVPQNTVSMTPSVAAIEDARSSRKSDEKPLPVVQVVQHYTRPMSEIREAERNAEQRRLEAEAIQLQRQQQVAAQEKAEANLPNFAKVPLPYAPTGRLLKAKLVTRVESGNYNAPIIALVTEALKFNGRTIIPVNTELHGRVDSASRFRSRLAAEREWVLVLPAQGKQMNGTEMVVVGDVLDRGDRSTPTARFTQNDMSYGFLGYTTKADNLNDLRIFLSSMLFAAAEFSMDRAQPDQGEYTTTNPQNAGLSGIQAVTDDYASRIQAEVALNGFFTVVPSGHDFYLYVDQTLIMDQAKIGGRELYVAQQQALRGDEGNSSDAAHESLSLEQQMMQQLMGVVPDTGSMSGGSSLLNTVVDPNRLKQLQELTEVYTEQFKQK